MKKTYSIFILIIVLVLAALSLAGCSPEPKTIKEIYIVSSVGQDVQIGDFDIANYRIRLIMTDGTDKYVTVKPNMIVTDLAVFEELGAHTLTLIYNNTTLLYPINIVERMFEVTFEVNGGSALAPRATAKLMERPLTSKEGYKFAGWYDNENFEGAQILFPLSVTEDRTLYARWVEDFVSVYQVTFDYNYDEAILYTPQLIPQGEKVIAPTFLTREGYTISGWYLDNTLWDFEEDTVSGNITLLAMWD
jgi:uncharacterized repeat protein (TIGR02543 family)